MQELQKSHSDYDEFALPAGYGYISPRDCMPQDPCNVVPEEFHTWISVLGRLAEYGVTRKGMVQ